MKRTWIPLLTLLVGLAGTVIGTWFVAQYFEVKTRAEFDEAAQATAETIQHRFEAYVALLRGCSGLFAVRRQVSAGEFRAFAHRLQVPDDYPGVQGIGFAARTRAEDREALIARMRAQGAPDFRIWPEEERAEYFPIIFLEPADRRNQAAIGFDAFSQPVRRAAMERARDEAIPVASGKVTLVQELEGPTQAGFVIYVPVYREGDVPATQAERRAMLQGFTYSPFRADDLFREFVDADSQQVFRLRVYDGEAQNQSTLLHVSSNADGKHSGHFQNVQKVNIAGRPWTLRFDSQPQFEARVQGGRIPLAMFLTGVLVSLLLFYFTNAEARARHAAEQALERAKRSREALRESEERFRLIVDSARDYGIMSLDRNGVILSWNSGAEHIYGYPASEIIGRNFSVLFTAEDQAAAIPQRELTEAVETGRVEHDHWLVTRSGERRFTSGVCQAIRDEFGNVHGLANVTRDITRRQQAEEALRKEKDFTDAIVQSVPGIFYVFNQNGKFIHWNRALERVTGYTRTELARMNISELVALDQRHLIEAIIREVFQQGQADLEAELQLKDGRRIPYFFTGSRVDLERGPAVVGMGMDIAERRRYEEALKQARDQLGEHARDLEHLVAERTAHLEQSLASLEGILYHVAHDLRAPLRAMHGFTSILLKEYAPHFDATGEEYARRISEASGRMDQLIRDLLEYGRLGHMPLPIGQVRLEETIKRVLGDFHNDIKAREADVKLEEPLPVVWANNTALEAIFSNLLSNALKFVQPGAKPSVRIRTEAHNGMVRVFVEDNGIGIDPKYQDRVFRVFERLHNTEQYPGTGIGLAIVQKATQRIHGNVGLWSTMGQGSTFWVDLPRTESPPAS